jgi:inorganic triphosphatase YgiF
MTEIELRDELKWFAEQMEKVLRDNDWKVNWKLVDFGELYERFYKDARLMMSEWINEDYWENYEDIIIAECVDVANYCMMIADKMKMIKEKQTGEQK